MHSIEPLVQPFQLCMELTVYPQLPLLRPMNGRIHNLYQQMIIKMDLLTQTNLMFTCLVVTRHNLVILPDGIQSGQFIPMEFHEDTPTQQEVLLFRVLLKKILC